MFHETIETRRCNYKHIVDIILLSLVYFEVIVCVIGLCIFERIIITVIKSLYLTQ